MRREDEVVGGEQWERTASRSLSARRALVAASSGAALVVLACVCWGHSEVRGLRE